MEHAPDIVTAVPKRRYRIDEFNAVILGELECRDRRGYLYVLALVRDGDADPVLYVTLGRSTPVELILGVTVAGDSRSYAAGSALTDLDEFSAVALDAAIRLFRLQDESPYQLM